MYLDLQAIDVHTCEPVPGVMLEIWHCNSTGVYGGIVAPGNGDSSDASNIYKTFLRGIQPTDADGVAQFETLFPGHYAGRTTHIHVMVHQNSAVLPNSTLGIGSGVISHVGQLFFDQALITEVESTAPYTANTQPLIKNAEDGIMQQEANTTDPVVDYVL